MLLRKIVGSMVTVIMFGAGVSAQTPEQTSLREATQAAVQVLTSKGNGMLDKRGAGVIIRKDGVILTSLALIEEATQVQIRLANGEIFDSVDLIAKDTRRGIAALRISGSNLPAILVSTEETRIGDAAFIISSKTGKAWRVDEAVLKGETLADEIPKAGEGFRVVRFTSSIDQYVSGGGILMDREGRAVGFVTRDLVSGSNANFAVPMSGIAGLGNMTGKLQSFANGSSLKFKLPVRAPSAIDIVSKDPATILKNAKIFHIYSYSFYIKARMMENALMRQSAFKSGSLKLVNDRKVADIAVNVEHKLFTWDYRYTVTDQKTGIILASEKVTVIDGKAAAKKFSKKLMALLRENANPAAALSVKASK